MGTVKEILALHGWAVSTEKWESISKELSKKGIKLNLPNIPVLTEKADKAWDLNNYVSWLKKQIGTKKVVLLGHSNGGRIALAFAQKYPENLKKIILIDSAGIYHNELPLKIKRFIFKGLASVGKKITTSESLRKYLYKLTGESDYKKANHIQRQTMVNLISEDLQPMLGNIKTPTLIIWGENDKATPLSDGKLMQKLIKGAKLKVINGAKHSPHFTHPKEVAEIINEYL